MSDVSPSDSATKPGAPAPVKKLRPHRREAVYMALASYVAGLAVLLVPITFTGPDPELLSQPLFWITTVLGGFLFSVPVYPLVIRLFFTKRHLTRDSRLLTALPGVVLVVLVMVVTLSAQFQVLATAIWAVFVALLSAVRLKRINGAQRFLGLTVVVLVAGFTVGALGYPFQASPSGASGKDPQITKEMKFGETLIDAYQSAYGTQFSIEAIYDSYGGAPLVDFLDIYPCGFNEVYSSVSYDITVTDGKKLTYRELNHPSKEILAKVMSYVEKRYPGIKPNGALYKYEGTLYAFGPVGLGSNGHPTAGLLLLNPNRCTAANLMPPNGNVPLR